MRSAEPTAHHPQFLLGALQMGSLVLTGGAGGGDGAGCGWSLQGDVEAAGGSDGATRVEKVEGMATRTGTLEEDRYASVDDDDDDGELVGEGEGLELVVRIGGGLAVRVGR